MARITLAGTKAVRSAMSRKTDAGGMTLNSTSLANVATGTDLVLDAAVGDKIEVSLQALAGAQAVALFLDVATIVAGSPVTYFSSGTATPTDELLPAWTGSSGVEARLGAPAMLTLVSGDISAGTVTLRLRYKTATATDKTLYAWTVIPLIFMARNFGSG